MGDVTPSTNLHKQVEDYVKRVDNSEEAVQQRIDDVDYRDMLMDSILNHIAKTSHTLSIVTLGSSHPETFVVCTGCDVMLGKEGDTREVETERCTYVRGIREELDL